MDTTNLETTIADLKTALAEAEEKLLQCRVEALEGTELVQNMESLFYVAQRRGFQWTNCGEIEEWAIVPGVDEIDEELREAFREHASQLGFNVDFEQGILLNLLSNEEITVNEDGDVFEGSKLIIHRDNYDNEMERNAQIETHMARTGYFPGVFLTDRHGNITPIDTKEKTV